MGSGTVDKDEQFERVFAHGVRLIKRAFDLYGAEGLAFSFNGGKDSTVLLHLLLHVAKLICEDQDDVWTRERGLLGVTTFFFRRPDEFAEVEAFVREADASYHLNVQVYECDFKQGLERLLQNSSVKAVLLGTRNGDPNCRDQEFFCPSSEGWPVFMRINPILNWTYTDVWTYLRREGARYCSLYDSGYTSLGSTRNTAPNSALLRPDGTYAAAHELSDDRLERAGRDDARADLERHRSSRAELSHTAALILVGDELVSGKVVDKNAPYLLPRLHALGWKVAKVSIVPDNVAAISREVSALKERCDVVITCGGLGPTEDDCTMAAIAVASETHLAQNTAMAQSVRDFFRDGATGSHMKLAEMPEGRTQLIQYQTPSGSTSRWPLLLVDNIFVLPGVPELVQEKWPPLQQHLQRKYGRDMAPFRNRVIKLGISDEATVAEPFARLVLEYPDISAGSYPKRASDGTSEVLISLEARDVGHLDAATARFKELLSGLCDPDLHPSACVLQIEQDVYDLDSVVE